MKLPQRLAGASSLFEHQEEIESAIDVLASPSVVDELGIGLIRDSFSDTLFPGVSTLQTRAKYFLTLPRIFRDYEQLTVNERRRISLADYLTQQENLCMTCLNHNHNNDPQEGIIGASYARKSGEVQRKPSSLYWNGLRTFGLIKTTLSLQEFVKSFANPDTLLLDLFHGTDETKGDASESVVSTPLFCEKWQEQLTLHLSYEEATFLARQIERHVPESLLGRILMDDTFRTTFVGLPNKWQFADFCDSSLLIDKVSTDLKSALFGARDFWQILKGAHIRYNVLLQRLHGTDEMRTEFEEKWTTWCEEMSRFPWDRWNTQLIWDLVNRHRRQLRDHTKRFVRNWIESIQSGTSDVTALDDLVTQQELLNKKARARLKPNATEQIKEWVGIESVDYRYSQVRTIIKDIHCGLTPQLEKADA
ncbi:MAG: hypothetical protein DWI15_00265 [Planctomycetota bacterium]|nr:MAG: hypothetical protein DWI15_00265 [Planctomycetota bacterium]